MMRNLLGGCSGSQVVGGVRNHCTERRVDATRESLGSAIRALLTDLDKLGMMAREGRRRAEQHFSWRQLGQELESWLLESVQDDSAPPNQPP